MFKKILPLLFILLIINFNFADDFPIDNSLNFSTIKTKYMVVDLNIESSIQLGNYKTTDQFTYKTPIFSNSLSQIVNLKAYYLDVDNKKIYAEIVKENENNYAVFKISPIERDIYTFFISGSIISENKIVLSNQLYSLANEITEEEEYKVQTKLILSDSLEIKAIAKYLKTSDNALENLVNVTNWVHDFLEYDLDYADVVNDSVTTLGIRKGVCDEFSILLAAILRAQGYPVKYVVGYANTGLDWGPHAWLEVYIPNQGWLGVDPTYNEVGFVDSSHIVLEKIKDPTDSEESVIATNNIDITFKEKKTIFRNKEVKSYEEMGYKDVLKMKMDFSKDNLENSPFILKLILQNTTNYPLTILVSANFSDDLKQLFPLSRKKIYYLAPFEEKTEDYFFILPSLLISHGYGYGSIGFSSQLGEVTDLVNIYTNKGNYKELFLVTPPFLYFKDNFFYYEQDIFNYTNKDKNLVLEFTNNNEITTKERTILKQTEEKYTVSFFVTPDSNFSYNISGDYNFSGNTVFYKEIEKEIVQPTITEEVYHEDVFTEIESKRINEKSELNYFVVVLIVVFLLFILFLFISKSLKKTNVS